jgi:hypothetical protein
MQDIYSLIELVLKEKFLFFHQKTINIYFGGFKLHILGIHKQFLNLIVRHTLTLQLNFK